MDNSVTDRLISYLREHDADFSVMHHEPARTSEDAARIRGTPLEQGAKAMLFSADGRPVLLVLPADRRIETRAFKKAFGVKDLRLIAADQLGELTGLEPGAVPPFGNLLGFPTYVDELLLDLPRIAFNAGSRTTSVVMSTRDYQRLAQPETARFAGEAPAP